MHRKQNDRRGGVAVVVAVGLVVLVTFVGLAIDLGLARLQRAELQAAVDSVAAAAATGIGGGISEARTRGLAVANAIHFQGGPLDLEPSDIEIGTWDATSQTFTPDPDGDVIRVLVPKTVSAMFGKVAGFNTYAIQAEAAVSASRKGGGGGCGVFGGEIADFRGNVHVDSFISTDGPYHKHWNSYENGSVCSNGNVELTGNTDVHGDIHPGPGKQAILTGNSYVSGDIEELAEEIPMPEVDILWAMANNDNAANGINNLKMKLTGNVKQTWGPGVIYLESLAIAGNSRLTIVPPVDLYVAGELDIAGNGVVNTGQNPADLTIYSAHTSVKMAGNMDFYGTLIAPNATVFIPGNSDWYGIVAGKKLEFRGNMDFHIDESLPTQFGLEIPSKSVETRFLH